MKLITRKQWGARNATCSTPLLKANVKGIAIHYTSAASDETGDPKERLRSVQNYHMSKAVDGGKGPWCDIAYSFAFDRNGDIFDLRGWDQRTAAQGTNPGNDNFIAIVFLGSDKTGRDDVTSKGRNTLTEFILEAEKHYGKKLDIQPHSYFHSTGCPGDELRNYIHLRPWDQGKEPLPVLPKWFYTWVAWKLGEGTFQKYGKANAKYRPKNVPKIIPPNAWLGLKIFLRNRNA